MIEGDAVDEDTLMEAALEAGAEDMTSDSGNYEIITDPNDFEKVASALSDRSIPHLEAQVAMVPKNHVKVEGKQAEQVLRLMEMFDDHDDVQNVWANFDIDEELLDT